MKLVRQEQGQSPKQGNKYCRFHKSKLIAYTPLCPLLFSQDFNLGYISLWFIAATYLHCSLSVETFPFI